MAIFMFQGKQIDPHDMGDKAFGDGLDVSAVPFPFDSKAAVWWWGGWFEARSVAKLRRYDSLAELLASLKG